MAKYIFVTGCVISSLGKGIAAASIGRLLESLQPQRGPLLGVAGHARCASRSPSTAVRHEDRFDRLAIALEAQGLLGVERPREPSPGDDRSHDDG